MYINKRSEEDICTSQPLSSESLTLNNTIIICSTISFIGCSLFLRILNTEAYSVLPNVKAYQICWRVISGIHGFYTFLFASLYLKKYISFLTWSKSLSFSLGYFVFDLSRHFFLDPLTPSTLLEPCIHHTIVGAVIISYVYKYPKLSALGFLSEFTTPLLYTCWFLLKGGYKNTILFKVLAALLLISFVLFRFYNFSRIYWQLYKKKAPTFELITFGPMVLINYYWFALLLRQWIVG